VHIGAYIEATNEAATPEELFHLYARATAAFGYDRIIYSTLASAKGVEVESPCILRNYPDDWIEYYVQHSYTAVDPVRTRGLRSNAPFLWSDLGRGTRLSAAERRVMDEGREAGLKDGVGIAFHGPTGVMGVGLATSGGSSESRYLLSVLNLLSVQFHTAFQSLTATGPLPEIRLTAREREILLWCSKGKSNWAIGEILRISEHGVDFHLRNILKKLSADSRITAVVKALRLGLIDP
jgi:DNA-binding CsgD family transcriptional regulator